MKTGYALIAILIAAVGCSTSGRMTIQDVKPARTYKAGVPAIFDVAREFSIQEGFHLDRFEQESGRIIGYKNIVVSSSEGGLSSSPSGNRRIVMILKIKAKDKTSTSLLASFVYGDEQVVLSRSDEEELLNCYSLLFRHLDSKLGPGELPTP